jgi:tRNA pseudouridine55 synthase
LPTVTLTPTVTSPATPDGLLLVDKPAGVSSHDVVNAARRAMGERRIGHAGTLDPFATGLLVLLVGRATRLLPHIPDEPKVYEARLAFGTETDTEDLLGKPVREAPRPTRAQIIEALPRFVGALDQVPPAYSAKRVDGQRAYALARAGVEVELSPVRIAVHRWEVLRVEEDADGRVAAFDARITCGGGTYVRSLARDLARAVGSAAHLTALRRVRTGPFDVADAVTLDALREGRTRLRPALEALPGFPQQRLSDDELAKIVRGIDVAATVPGAWGALVRATVRTDRATDLRSDHRTDVDVLVALAERRGAADAPGGARWQPRVVMREA